MSTDVTSTPAQRLPQLDRATISNHELLEVLARADRLSTPKPEWFLATGHAAEMAIGFDRYWDLTFRGGRVEHTTKELMRLAITTLMGCRFCSGQVSIKALEEGMQEEDMAACALPDFNHPDLRVRAALRYARAFALDLSNEATDWDDVYGELREYYDDGEIAELVYLTANILGGTMVARSLGLTVD